MKEITRSQFNDYVDRKSRDIADDILRDGFKFIHIRVRSIAAEMLETKLIEDKPKKQ